MNMSAVDGIQLLSRIGAVRLQKCPCADRGKAPRDPGLLPPPVSSVSLIGSRQFRWLGLVVSHMHSWRRRLSRTRGCAILPRAGGHATFW